MFHPFWKCFCMHSNAPSIFFFFLLKVRMYQKYSERNSWKCTPLSSSDVCLPNFPSELCILLFLCDLQNFSLCIYFSIIKAEKGGFKTFVMEIKGNRVFSKLKYESGVHRVQRVPQTETQGRVHTSTATVAIMPEVECIWCAIYIWGFE